MSDKPITGSDSLFADLFGPRQTREAIEVYRRALKEATHEVAAWDEAQRRNTVGHNCGETAYITCKHVMYEGALPIEYDGWLLCSPCSQKDPSNYTRPEKRRFDNAVQSLRPSHIGENA